MQSNCVICLPMEHQSSRELVETCHCIPCQIKLEFGNVAFRGEGKTRVPVKKPLGALGNLNTSAALIPLGRVTCIMHTHVVVTFVIIQKINLYSHLVSRGMLISIPVIII